MKPSEASLIVLELHPCKGSPGLYEARIGPVAIVRSRQPFFAAARELLRRGVDPDAQLAARHAGSAIVAMRSTVGEAAKWAIEEGESRTPRKRKWKPYQNARSGGGGVPENARSAVSGTSMAVEPESASTDRGAPENQEAAE